MYTIKVDYIVVGQGLVGTWLSYELIKKNKSVMVMNHSIENTSSKKAAGLYSPITGRRMVKTWRADDFFPSLENEYHQLELLLKERFLHSRPIYKPFRSISDQNDWQGKQTDKAYSRYIEYLTSNSLRINNILDFYGGVIIKNSGYVDLPVLLASYKKYLINKGIYIEELFDISEMQHSNDGITYKQWEAKKILFCEGPFPSKLWEKLPFKPVRGEIIDISCELDTNYIINRGVFIVPKNGFFTVGSTYDHQVLTFQPQYSGISDIKERLGKIFAETYHIIDERAGVRPATYDRRPYIGFHKNFKAIGIFNGFGSKGVSLSPYFAKHFANVLEKKEELEKEVNVERIF
ncbi:MAG: FAD-dependent oxidoreductase [Bacteroidota bacterium]